MPRTIWSRLFGRERDFDPPQIFDLFHEAEPRHAGIVADFHNRIRQTRDEPTTLHADPRPAAAAPAAPVFSIADRIDAATAFTFTVRPATVESVFTAAVRPVTVVTPAPEATTAPATADIAEDPVAASRTPDPNPAPEAADERRVEIMSSTSGPIEGIEVFVPQSGRFGGGSYIITYAEDFSTLVYDTAAGALLTGGLGDWSDLLGAPTLMVEISGDHSAGFGLPGSGDIDILTLRRGSDYNLFANDNDVGTGETLTINAMPLGDGDGVAFDGSAESDGGFDFYGSQGGDLFFGGEGDDRMSGFGGADMLHGGGGRDIFVYAGARDSTGADYDTLVDFDPAVDRIIVPGGIDGFGDPVEGGTLSTATFNDDLAAAVGGLGSGQAVWFAPDAGDLAGQVFLIVDGNGQPGYQDGEDYVIAVSGAPLADLTGHTDIFI